MVHFRLVRFLLLLVCLSTFGLLGPRALAAGGPPAITGTGAILIDMSTGQVLYHKNENLALQPASITKIMTALVALKYGPPLDQEISVPPEAYGVKGSSVYLVPGQKMTFRDLLYGLLLRSGNDAAVAIAVLTAGSVDGFSAMMNAECQKLGCTHSHFVNPNGLPAPDHYTSVADMAKITRAAMAIPAFRQIVATKSYPFPGYPKPFVLYNQDKLLWNYPGAIGVKIGYTIEAKETIVAAAERNGVTLIAIVMQTTHPRIWLDPEDLLTWGFNSFQRVNAVTRGQVLGHSKDGGKTLPLVAAGTLTWLAPTATQPVVSFHLDPRLPTGTIKRGETLGAAKVYSGGQLVGTVPMMAGAGFTPPSVNLFLVTAASVMMVVFVARVRGNRRRWKYRPKYRLLPRRR